VAKRINSLLWIKYKWHFGEVYDRSGQNDGKSIAKGYEQATKQRRKVSKRTIRKDQLPNKIAKITEKCKWQQQKYEQPKQTKNGIGKTHNQKENNWNSPSTKITLTCQTW